MNAEGFCFKSRGDWIRTSDLLVPNQALYQAEPRPGCSVKADQLPSREETHSKQTVRIGQREPVRPIDDLRSRASFSLRIVAKH